MTNFIQDFIRYRELIELLTEREIKIRYKQSILGVSWAIFQPLIMVILFTAIFTKIVKMPTQEIPYPVFFLSGLIPWTFFANSLTAAIPSIVNNGELVKKIYFPRVIFPLVSILAAFFDFLVSFILLIFLMIYFKIKISAWLFFVPVILGLELILTVSFSLLLSALNVFYRDVKNALINLIQIWMFATPVIYPLEAVRPHLRILLLLNPMTGLIDGFRKTLIEGIPPNGLYLAVSLLLTALLFSFAHNIFKRLEPNFADSL